MRKLPKKLKTPVIAGRVPTSLYRKIKSAAKKSGRSQSDEIAWRIGLSFVFEAILRKGKIKCM